MGVNTIIDLRGEWSWEVKKERRYARSLGMNFVNLPGNGWSPPSDRAQTANFCPLLVGWGPKRGVYCRIPDCIRSMDARGGDPRNARLSLQGLFAPKPDGLCPQLPAAIGSFLLTRVLPPSSFAGEENSNQINVDQARGPWKLASIHFDRGYGTRR